MKMENQSEKNVATKTSKEPINPIVMTVLVGIAAVLLVAVGMALYNTNNPSSTNDFSDIGLTEEEIYAAYAVIDELEILYRNEDVDDFVNFYPNPLPAEEIDGNIYYPIQMVFVLPSDEIVDGIESIEVEEGNMIVVREVRTYTPYYISVENGTASIKDDQGNLQPFNYTYDNYSVQISLEEVDDGTVSNYFDANQTIFSKGVISKNPYITNDTPVETLDIEDEETGDAPIIDGVKYYPIQINTFKIPEDYEADDIFDDHNRDKTFGPYYINYEGDVHLLDENGVIYKFDFEEHFEHHIQH